MSSTRSDWVVRAPGPVGRMEACFSGRAFSPHRHDTYAVALTLQGVQSFRYRGATRHSRPGQVVVIHPDELHDGRAGDGTTFRYRAIYLSPAHLQRILGGRALPFIATGVSSDPRLLHAARALLDDFTRPLAGLEFADGLQDLAHALLAVADAPSRSPRADYRAVLRAQEYVDAHLDTPIGLTDLECASGRDRWRLSRDFRAVLGSSPYRYWLLRRLDRARALMRQGRPLAEVACACGFADQSHFTRQFRKAFGMTPSAWRRHEGPLPR